MLHNSRIWYQKVTRGLYIQTQEDELSFAAKPCCLMAMEAVAESGASDTTLGRTLPELTETNICDELDNATKQLEYIPSVIHPWRLYASSQRHE